ncbi:MAG: RNase adapter RapZ [Gemmatimonadales bacterium]|jgi:aminoglycoside/choline kinase family phosphotransferase
MKERIIGLAEERYGRRPDVILDMAADGSTRQYFRLVWDRDRTVVGAIGPDRDENRAFLAFARAFREAGLPVPEIYAEDREAGVWLEEDLGDTTLFIALGAARVECGEDEFPAEIEALYRKVLAVLPRFQVTGHEVIDYRLAYPRQAFDEQSIRWDLNYFKYHFLKLAHVEFNEQRLEDDFARLTRHLLEAGMGFFLYRDFQSRNVMIRDGEPWFLDFQGGRRGAPQYDVASLLYDAKANIPPHVRAGLLEHYLDELSEHVEVDRASFRERFTSFVLVRLMQAMGAYGYRGFFERKRRFLESVPNAARNLEHLLEAGLPLELPELEVVYRRIADRWARPRPEGRPASDLAVTIRSFSYRDGYPPDLEGHGGGYVFDCRALPNPHDVPELRDLTGEDREVADWLEREREVQEFWESVRGMVEPHVERYVTRGFSSLTVAFGCTGGQHRSVFMAAKLAEYLATRHPHVDVRLRHGRV